MALPETLKKRPFAIEGAKNARICNGCSRHWPPHDSPWPDFFAALRQNMKFTVFFSAKKIYYATSGQSRSGPPSTDGLETSVMGGPE
jgi:hypothetical protein